jgi:BirA family biotin operon repressor/biotin-[acetyl-CoA-carboxylase] ligase
MRQNMMGSVLKSSFFKDFVSNTILGYHDCMFIETLDSTNLFAKRNLAILPLDEMTVIHTSYQTLGLGTNERAWHSKKGENILATYCFAKGSALPHQYTQTLAIAARNTLAKLKVVSLIKWPNDLLVSGKKIAGIKAEAVDSPLFIIGIGLNVNMADTSQISQPATSIFLETGIKYEVDFVLDLLSKEFKRLLEILHTKGFSFLLPLYSQGLELYQGKVVTSNEGNGYLAGVTKEGFLLLETKEGKAKIIQSGSISPL